MKHCVEKTEMREVKTTEVEEITCDLCGKPAPTKEPAHPWERGLFDVNRVQVSHHRGVRYPEGGSGEKLDLDICPSCFENVLFPFLREKGLTKDYEQYDT
jgi:hypothetical protein